MKVFRLNRLFNPRSARCFDVATDVAKVYGTVLPRALFNFNRMLERAVEQAVVLDAACVVVNLFAIPDQPENILKLKPECDRYAMPLMIEPLVFAHNTVAGGYMVDGDLRRIKPLVRQAVEQGADIIKADPTDDVLAYHEVVDVARVPLLVRGGGRASDVEVLRRTEALIAQGASGIVYGRNAIAAYLSERAGELGSRSGCATLGEALGSQLPFAAALQSQARQQVVEVDWSPVLEFA
jgi:hypothetical protein